MCHIAGTLGTLKQPGADRVITTTDVTDDGIYCRRRLALTAETQRQLRIGTSSPGFTTPYHGPPTPDRGAIGAAARKSLISYEYGKRLHGDESMSWGAWGQHVRNVLGGVGELVAFGHHMARDRVLAARKFPSVIVKSTAGHYSLDFTPSRSRTP